MLKMLIIGYSDTNWSAYLGRYEVSGDNSYWGLNLGATYEDGKSWSGCETAVTARTVNKIDVTGYTKLTCKFFGSREGSGSTYGWQKAVIGICSTDSTGNSLLNGDNYYKKTVSNELTKASGGIYTLELDLTDVEGEYYVCFSIISYLWCPAHYGQSFYRMILN